MSTTMSRHTDDATTRRVPRVVPAGTARSIGGAIEDRPRHSPTRRGRGIVSGRVLLLGLGIAVAWGLFLWLVISGSIASFGNPWLSS
jgi:hypothetical protein